MEASENTDDKVEVGGWIKERILGSGGFGIVVLWKKKNSSDAIALKQCSWGHNELMTPKHKHRWKMEVDIMKRLSHPNVVKATEVPEVLDVPETELPLLAMEYCNGGDLRKVLSKPENCCGLSEKEVRNLVRQIASAVKYLHSQRIIHRDLKPENIVLQEADGKTVYKLIDLGYAKELDQGSLCTSFVGTLQYLAPELFMNNRYSCTVDYWSLGLVTHEVITGQRPFLPNMTPAQWIPHVKDKSSNSICAHIDDDGKVVLSDELSPYTKISNTLKKEMEEWLKVMLDWDSVRRGRRETETGFELLEKFLDKKFVQVFCTNTCTLLTYQVEESTTLKEFQLWLEKDTNIPYLEQEILLPKGLSVDPSKPAIQCWTNPEQEDAVVFLSNKNDSYAFNGSKPTIPTLVERMIRSPRLTVEYERQRLAWVQAVYFCTHERMRSFKMAYAYKANLNYFLSKLSNMKRTSMTRATEVIKMYSRHDFFRTSLEKDMETYRRQAKDGGVTSNKMEQKWQKYFTLSDNIQRLQEKIKELERHSTKVNEKASELQKSPYARSKLTDLTEEKYQKTVMAYHRLKRKPKDERTVPADNTEMVQLVCAFMQQNDKRLEDIYENLRILRQTRQEIDELQPQLDSILDEVQGFSQQIENAQLQRQRDMWNLLDLVIKRLKAPGQYIVSGNGESSQSSLLSQHDYFPMQNSLTSASSSFMLDNYHMMGGHIIPHLSSLLSQHSSLSSPRESLACASPSLSAIREKCMNDSQKILEENQDLREKMDSIMSSITTRYKHLGINSDSKEMESTEDTEKRNYKK